MFTMTNTELRSTGKLNVLVTSLKIRTVPAELDEAALKATLVRGRRPDHSLEIPDHLDRTSFIISGSAIVIGVAVSVSAAHADTRRRFLRPHLMWDRGDAGLCLQQRMERVPLRGAADRQHRPNGYGHNVQLPHQ